MLIGKTFSAVNITDLVQIFRSVIAVKCFETAQTFIGKLQTPSVGIRSFARASFADLIWIAFPMFNLRRANRAIVGLVHLFKMSLIIDFCKDELYFSGISGKSSSDGGGALKYSNNTKKAESILKLGKMRFG